MKRLANVATAGFYGVVLLAAFHTTPSKHCEASGGKWAAASEVCITRACFASGTCGKWTHPAGQCAEVKAGADRAEVYFQFGEPDEVRADEAIWQAAKASPGFIIARFQGDKVMSLSCPAEQQAPPSG